MSEMQGERKYRILQVHNYYQIPGGEDTVVANEKKMLEEHGHTVIRYIRKNSEIKGFSVLRKIALPFTTIYNPRTYRDVRRIIKKEKIDIVHVHNTLNLISPAVYYAAVKMKVPVIQTVHNFRLLCPGATFYRDGHICEDCLEHGLFCAVKHGCYRNSRAQTLICVINTLIHRATGIYKKINYICLTEFNKQKLLNLKQIKESQIFVKPNFVADEGSVVSYNEREDYYIYVGRLDETKGIKALLEGWKGLTDITSRLVICGSGPLEEWCRQYVKDNNLANVDIRGQVDNKEAKRLMAASKALLMPTQWYEGFPMTIAEAYSVGTPVIGSDIGNVGSLIEDGLTGIKTDFADACGYKKSIERLEQMATDVTEKNIQDFYYERYSKQVNYKVLSRIYKKVSIKR